MILYDIQTGARVNASGAVLRDQIRLGYKTRPTWQVKFVAVDDETGVSAINVSAAVAWKAAVDKDFSHSTEPMCRTLDADIDHSLAASGIISVSPDADTSTFANALGSTPEISAYFELQGLDSNGMVIYDARFKILACNSIDPEGGTPPEPASDAATKTWTEIQLITKADADDLYAHTGSTVNPHSVTAAQVGLGNVDNTADADKPVSTAQQTAIDAIAFAGYPAQGRLTLTSGDPEGSTSVTGGSTLYYSPYCGDRLALYYNSAWNLYTFAETSLDLSALAADTIYDVFACYNGSAVTLEALAWSSASARATALTRQNGVYVKSGDPTRRYLGTVRTTATTGTSANTENKRFIYNYYNKLPFAVKTANSNASWTYTTAAWREYNGGTGQTRAEFVAGMTGGNYSITFSSACSTVAANISSFIGMAINSTTASTCHFRYKESNKIDAAKLADSGGTVAQLGYNYATQLECADGTNAMTVYGSGYGGKITLNM